MHSGVRGRGPRLLNIICMVADTVCPLAASTLALAYASTSPTDGARGIVYRLSIHLCQRASAYLGGSTIVS